MSTSRDEQVTPDNLGQETGSPANDSVSEPAASVNGENSAVVSPVKTATVEGSENIAIANDILPTRADSIKDDLQSDLIARSKLTQAEINTIFSDEKIKEVVLRSSAVIAGNAKLGSVAPGELKEAEKYMKSSLIMGVDQAFKLLSASDFKTEHASHRLLLLKFMSLSERANIEREAQLAKFDKSNRLLIDRINAQHSAELEKTKADYEALILKMDGEKAQAIDRQVQEKAAEIQAEHDAKLAQAQKDYADKIHALTDEHTRSTEHLVTQLEEKFRKYTVFQGEIDEKVKAGIEAIKATIQITHNEELDALKAIHSQRLSENQEELQKQYAERLKVISQANEEQLKALKVGYDEATEKLSLSQAAMVTKFTETANKERDSALAELKSAHESAVKTLQESRDAELARVRADHEKAMQASKEAHEAEIARLDVLHKANQKASEDALAAAETRRTTELTAAEARRTTELAAAETRRTEELATAGTKHQEALTAADKRRVAELADKDATITANQQASEKALTAAEARRVQEIADKDKTIAANQQASEKALTAADTRRTTELAALEKRHTDELAAKEQEIAALQVAHRQAEEAEERRRIHDKVERLITDLDFETLEYAANHNNKKSLLKVALENDLARTEEQRVTGPLISNPSKVIRAFADHYKNSDNIDLSVVNMLSEYATSRASIDRLVNTFATPENSDKLPKLKEKFLGCHHNLDAGEYKDKLSTKDYVRTLSNAEVLDFMSLAKKLGVKSDEAAPYFARERAIAVQYGWFECLAHYATATRAYASTAKAYEAEPKEKREKSYGWLEALVYTVTCHYAYADRKQSYRDLVIAQSASAGHDKTT